MTDCANDVGAPEATIWRRVDEKISTALPAATTARCRVMAPPIRRHFAPGGQRCRCAGDLPFHAVLAAWLMTGTSDTETAGLAPSTRRRCPRAAASRPRAACGPSFEVCAARLVEDRRDPAAEFELNPLALKPMAKEVEPSPSARRPPSHPAPAPRPFLLFDGLTVRCGTAHFSRCRTSTRLAFLTTLYGYSRPPADAE